MIPVIIPYEYQHALSTAISHGDTAEVQRLMLEGKIDANAFFDDYRRNILMEVLSVSQDGSGLAILRWLLEQGADPAICCRYRHNALQVARSRQLDKAQALLLEFHQDAGTAIHPEFPSKLLYPELAQRIRTELVPPAGPASTVQGEMMRIIDYLRKEVRRDANISFPEEDKNLARFVRNTLVRSGLFGKEVVAGIRFAAGKIIRAKPYSEDEVYDYLVDRICVFYRKNEQGIPMTPPISRDGLK